MELKEFISETFIEIFEGIRKSQEYAKENGGYIAPAHIVSNSGATSIGEVGKRYVRTPALMIDFEVSLTEMESSGNRKSLGVSFSGIGAEIGKNKGGENTSSTKIKFSIPVIYPSQK